MLAGRGSRNAVPEEVKDLQEFSEIREKDRYILVSGTMCFVTAD